MNSLPGTIVIAASLEQKEVSVRFVSDENLDSHLESMANQGFIVLATKRFVAGQDDVLIDQFVQKTIEQFSSQNNAHLVYAYEVPTQH